MTVSFTGRNWEQVSEQNAIYLTRNDSRANSSYDRAIQKMFPNAYLQNQRAMRSRCERQTSIYSITQSPKGKNLIAIPARIIKESKEEVSLDILSKNLYYVLDWHARHSSEDLALLDFPGYRSDHERTHFHTRKNPFSNYDVSLRIYTYPLR